MTLSDLIESLPADLIALVRAGEDDPILASGCDVVRDAVKAYDGNRHVSRSTVEGWSEAIESWMLTQTFLQEKAADLIAMIAEEFPESDFDDYAAWALEWWSVPLHNPWAERLDEACYAAQEWLESR